MTLDDADERLNQPAEIVFNSRVNALRGWAGVRALPCGKTGLGISGVYLMGLVTSEACLGASRSVCMVYGYSCVIGVSVSR